MRILVLGYLVRGPLGGLAWHHLQYVLGLARLGHDVHFLEDSEDYPSCYDPSRDALGCDPAYGLGFAARAFARLGLPGRWAYFDAHAGRWWGPCAGRVPALAAGADLLLNVSGVNPIRPWLEGVPARALIDTDPVFTQIRHLQDPVARARAELHTAFFTFAERWAERAPDVPDDGLPWRPTRQPVVLDAWPVTPGHPRGRFTTVMQWESYPERSHEGRTWGTKGRSFAAFRHLPAATGDRFELALGSAGAPRAALRDAGWIVRDPLGPTRTPWSYQRFIRRSSAEFGVAKHAYVAAATGWFSERSAAYLASGRPVVTQDTGFRPWLPVGAGLHAFASPAEAADAVRDVRGRYAWHCRAARELAEAHFDSDAVLSRLVEEATGRPPPGDRAGAPGTGALPEAADRP